MEYRARWQNGILRLITNQPPDLCEDEIVIVSIERVRSEVSHKHQFAWVKEAWANLPEQYQDRRWAETSETLRKHALIATGFFQTYTIDCGAHASAHRVKAALVAAEAKAEGYAVGQVRGPVLTIWTPQSQSYRAMGKERFQESKQAILEWIADKIGCEPEELRRAAA